MNLITMLVGIMVRMSLVTLILYVIFWTSHGKNLEKSES